MNMIELKTIYQPSDEIVAREIEGELNKENLFSAIKKGECKPRINGLVNYYFYILSRNIFFVRPLAKAIY